MKQAGLAAQEAGRIAPRIATGAGASTMPRPQIVH